MAETIGFFTKWTTLLGGSGAAITYYSDPFDVTPYKTLDIEVMVKGLTGGVPTAQLEESSDIETWTSTPRPSRLCRTRPWSSKLYSWGPQAEP